jgi:tetratricopeptide (TPR) repeat protein
MKLEEQPAAEASKSITCGNCGRLYGPKDGMALLQGTCNSIIYMRGLFTGKSGRILCPACDSAIAFEPGVFVVGIDPPAAYISGGDALTTEQTHTLGRELRTQAASEGRSLDVQTFESQPDLLVALLERLRLAARAMKALNAANAKGELPRFMAEHWRNITPEVLVASDVVTLVEHLGKDSEEDEQKGLAYFSGHAEALGRLQAMSWLALCNSHGGSPSSEHTLDDDLTAYVEECVLFNTAIDSLEEKIQHYEAQNQGLEHWLVSYCMHALLARARRLRKQPNKFGEDWTVRWMELEYLLRSQEADLVARLQPCELSAETVAGTLQRKAIFDVAVQRLAPFLSGESPAEVKRWAYELQPICEKAGYPDLGVEIVQSGVVFKTSGVATASQAIALVDRMAVNAARMGRSKNPISEQMLTTACGELIAASDAESVRQVFEHVSETVVDEEMRGTLESWLGATLLRMHREQQFLDVVGAEERDWEARLTDSTKGRLWTERANALRAAGRMKETLAWRRRALQIYQNEPRSHNYRNSTRLLSIAERETGALDRARDLILPLLEDVGSLDRVTMLDTASATWIALGDRPKACAALEEAIELATGPEAHRKQHLQASLASLRYEADVVAIERALLETPRGGWNSPTTLLQECAAWLNLQMRGHQPSAEAQARYGEALAALSATLKSGDMPAAWREHAFMVLAKVDEENQLNNAYEFWGAAADAADALGMVPQPEVVLARAAFCAPCPRRSLATSSGWSGSKLRSTH